MIRPLPLILLVLGAACSGSSDAPPVAPPVDALPRSQLPLTGTVAPCNVVIDTERELVIRAVGVVEDPVRTRWTGGFDDPRDGAWSFGRLMAQLAASSGVPASQFVRGWLAHWEANQTVGGFVVPARPNITSLVIAPWPKLGDGSLDLTRAPMRLLAIVNRLDLRAPGIDSGEGRFVFGVLGPAGDPLPFTVILEYRLPGSTQAEVASWAQRWHALGASVPGTATYNDALQALTDSFTDAGPPLPPGGPPRPTTLNQLRTNENALLPTWELREFRIGADGLLHQSLVALTPDSSLNQSTLLANFINQNATDLIAGRAVSVPAFIGSSPFGGGSSLNTVNFWRANGVDPRARFTFGINTCDGCHGAETGVQFLHINPRVAGQEAGLSAFMTGTPAIIDPGGLPHSFNELQRRLNDLGGILCTGIPPSVNFVSPTFSTVAGELSLIVDANDDKGVASVEFRVGEATLGTVTSSPVRNGSFSLSWNTLAVADGQHLLTAVARDGDGNTSMTIRSVQVVNHPPAITLTAPSSGAVVGGTTPITAFVDGSFVTGVDYFVDGVAIGSVTTSAVPASLSLPWDTTTFGNGSHTVMVQTALSSESGPGGPGGAPVMPASASRTVTVSNANPAGLVITSPASMTQVSGTTEVLFQGGSGSARADLAVDGKVVASVSPVPTRFTWDTRPFADGQHTLVVRTRSSSGAVTSVSAPRAVVVNNPNLATGGPGSMGMGAPACFTAGNDCYSGTLLVGRGPLGPEANAPNTLGSECLDGTSGTFHVDGSVEQIAVVRADATPFATGKQVEIRVDVWGSQGPVGMEYLDVFTAPDGFSPMPAWQLLQSMWVMPGPQTVTLSYLLPAGGPQVIRAVIRRMGWDPGPAPCTTGAFDDHDDLVFAVNPAEPDAQAPTVRITAPAASAVVGGTVMVTADATDNQGVTRVDFFDGSTLIGSSTTPPFSISWGTAGTGPHTLSARAFDFAGNSALSPAVSVNVDNTPPTVAWSSPINGMTISGTVPLRVTTSDNAGMQAVVYFVGGMFIAQATVAPFSVLWDSTAPMAPPPEGGGGVPNGTHQFQAVAFDLAGNRTEAVIWVNVNNGP